MRAELVTIGSELLLGFTVDANSAVIGRQLAEIGVTVARRTSVGDEASEIAAAVREALDRTGAVITTGGLGPTSDDLTKPSIAAIFGKGMRLDEGVLDGLRHLWIARGLGPDLPRANERQATVPDGATILTNRHGSAPGIWLEDERGWVAMLPGVPREMRGMLHDEILPRLEERLRASGESANGAPIALSRTVRTTGVAESALADAIGPVTGPLAGVALAYLPSWSGVDLRVTSFDRPRAAAGQALSAAEGVLRAAAGAYAYGSDAEDLAAIVLDMLRSRGLTLAVAESCTGGLLGARLTAVPGSSDVFVGGVIAYSNDVKREHLGVAEATLARHGAVSEETAREMAQGVRARCGTGVAAAITGVAGPGGGTPEKPAGTVCVAVDTVAGVVSERRKLIGDREEVRLRATQWALDRVRRLLAP